MRLNGKNRDTIEKLIKNGILFQLLFLFLNGLLRDLGLSHSILYVMDAVNLAMIGCMILWGDRKRLRAGRLLFWQAGAWLAFLVLSACINGPSLLRMLWAGRNWCRGFVLLAECLLFLDESDAAKLFQLLKGLYVINFLMICAEFLFLDRRGDFLGGLFGSEVGANAMTNVFLCILLTYSLCRSCQEEKLHPFTIFALYSAMLTAALEEIKIFYLEYLLIVGGVLAVYGILGMRNGRFLARTVLHGVLALGLGLWVLYLVFPNHFRYVVGQRSYSEYEQKSKKSYRISRIHFIKEINQYFFHWDLRKNLIGLGLGNCDYSRFGFLTSQFYQENWEYNYLFFAHQPLYLEGGIIGLVLYVLIPFTAAVRWGWELLKKKTADPMTVFGCVFGLITAMNVFYNNAGRTEVSYMTFLAFAAVCLCRKRNWGSQG